MLVAQGSVDVMVDHGVHAWDIAALIPIVEEAGGTFTDWSGQRTIHSTDVVACNPALHGPVCRILKSSSMQKQWPADDADKSEDQDDKKGSVSF